MYEFFDAKRVVIVDVPGRRDAAEEGEYGISSRHRNAVATFVDGANFAPRNDGRVCATSLLPLFYSPSMALAWIVIVIRFHAFQRDLSLMC